MQELVSILQWMMLITFLCYIPIVCNMDLKHRMVEHFTWRFIGITGILLVFPLFLIGIYEWWMLIPSLFVSVVFFVMQKVNWIGGADFVFVSLISLLFLYNPLSGHILPIFAFIICLISCTVIAGIIAVTLNFIRGYGLKAEFAGGYPMMFVISAAFIMTVVLY